MCVCVIRLQQMEKKKIPTQLNSSVIRGRDGKEDEVCKEEANLNFPGRACFQISLSCCMATPPQ